MHKRRIMKLLLKISILILLSVTFVGCADSSKSTHSTQRSENKLEKLIIEEGDDEAYSELYVPYCCEYGIHKLLPYSFVMANTYKKGNAYYDVYFELMVLYRQNMNLVDEDVAEVMMKYLTKAMEFGNENATKRCNESGIEATDTNLEKIRKIYNKFYK